MPCQGSGLTFSEGSKPRPSLSPTFKARASTKAHIFGLDPSLNMTNRVWQEKKGLRLVGDSHTLLLYFSHVNECGRSFPWEFFKMDKKAKTSTVIYLLWPLTSTNFL